MKNAHPVAASAPLTPDTYIYKILLIDTNLVSISSDDSLRSIDPLTLRLDSSRTRGRIHDGVTCLRAFRERGILTAGRDGSVKCTDLRTNRTTLELSTEIRLPFLSLAGSEHVIAAGTELINSQATIITWDPRATKEPLLEYTESHNDDVTDLSLHPANPSVLLSGSTDGLVNLYDTSFSDGDDALIQVFNHGSSIAHADFLSDHEVFALSHDEIFSVYETGELDQDEGRQSVQAFGDLRPQLECEYIVDLVSSEASGPVLGAGSYSVQHLDIVPLQNPSSWTLDKSKAIRLPGAHGEEIVRSICFGDDSNTVFTAGEDGLIKAWRASKEDDDAIQPKVPTNIDKKRAKHKSINKDERARFKPY